VYLNVFGFDYSLCKKYFMERLMVLGAIWLEKPIMLEDEEGVIIPTRRLCEGQHISYANNFLNHVSPSNPANATIVQCRGDLYSTVLLLDIVTNDLKTRTIVIKDEGNIFKKR
jgi:hypothetical protein